jgi:formyl-CoA transferase
MADANTAQGILEGIRVVEVATFIFGPGAGTVMSDFGAEVIKIEHPLIGDPYRYLFHLDPLPKCEQNYCWILESRNKKSIAVDLKHADGRGVVLDLVRGADVLITNFHPSVLGNLGLRYEDLEPLNERLIYAHATGFGEDGDEVEKPGYDATAWWARSGMMDAVRTGEGEPGLATPGMGDHPSALALFGGILLALLAREKTGRGTKVSSSLIANGAWANGVYVQAALCGAEPFRPPSRIDPPNALVRHYATADGRRLYLAMVQEAREWEGFCDAVERPDLISDPRFAELPKRRENAAALAAILDEVFAARPLAEWRERLDRGQVSFGQVARSQDLPDDAQMIANGVFREIRHPKVGRLRTVDSPIWLRGTSKVEPGLAPEIGENTVEVLQALGYSEAAIAELQRSGAVKAANGETA